MNVGSIGVIIRPMRESAADGTRDTRSGSSVPATKAATWVRAVGAFAKNAMHPWVMRSATLDQPPAADRERARQERQREYDAENAERLLPGPIGVRDPEALDDRRVRSTEGSGHAHHVADLETLGRSHDRD